MRWLSSLALSSIILMLWLAVMLRDVSFWTVGDRGEWRMVRVRVRLLTS